MKSNSFNPRYLFFVLAMLLIGLALYYEDSQEREKEKLEIAKSEIEKVTSDFGVASTVWYQTAGEVRALYYQAYNIANLQLETKLSNYSGSKKPAIVLDIDETVLNNSPHSAKSIDSNSMYPAFWKEWINCSCAKALPGAVEFTKKAAKKGVEVFYITNRKEKYSAVTIKNMQNAGFPMADKKHILLRGKSGSNKESRRDSVRENYEILMFFGDNLADFDSCFFDKSELERNQLTDKHKELFGEKFFILPNPLYGDWEGALLDGEHFDSRSEKANALKKHLTEF